MEKLGNNDPCWCDSGEKYKKCHRDRDRERPEHPSVVRQQFRKEFSRKTCLHPLAASGLCGKVIQAHTIQRAAALREIVDASNKVRTFAPFEMEMLKSKTPRAVGWYDASTFPGFCSVHDSVFAPVETQPFTGSREQCFLLAYRALCHEHFQKQASLRIHGVARHTVDRGQPERTQRLLQTHLERFTQGVALGAKDAVRAKQRMDADLLAGNFSAYDAALVHMHGPLSIAVAGAMSPEVDLDGASIQSLADTTREVQGLFINIVPRAGGASVVFGWRGVEAAPKQFVDSLLRLRADRLPSTIAQVILAHIENVYFSAAWWDGLGSAEREVVFGHVANAFPYNNVPTYSALSVVPWTLDSVEQAR